VAFGSVFVPYGWAYALGVILLLALLIFFYSLAYTALVNRLQGRRKSPWPLFLQGITHLFLWVLILLVYYPVVQVVAASFDPTNNLFSFKRPNTGFLLLDAKVIPYLPEPLPGKLRQAGGGGYPLPLPAWPLPPGGPGPFGGGGHRASAPPPAGGGVDGLLAGKAPPPDGPLPLRPGPKPLPKQFTGQGTETKFLLWVRNTFLISGLTGLLAVLLTATAGYAFARFRHLPGRYPLLLFFIFVQMFPGFLALVAIYYLLSRLDLPNTFTGLVLAYSGGIISFGTWVYKGYLESISPSLEEAAMVDGATKWQVFTKILLPLSAPCSSSSSSCSSWAPTRSSSWPTWS
jgi:arabinogalactan oligomer/maltooligosaccharide transport system permease protein